ncbi:MAG: DUF1801 domain-containing protein [Sphingomonadaceae bacterium]
MAEIKTRPTPTSVAAFIDAVDDPLRRADGQTVCDIMTRISGEQPQMWGPSIIGFGSYNYKYDSGHSGTMCRIGFSPRKAELVLYVLTGADAEAGLLARLGKHKTGKACLYIKRLEDVDLDVFCDLIVVALADMNRRYPKD